MSNGLGVAIFIAADIGITIVILGMLGKLPVRRIVEWARAHRWI